MKLFFQYQKPMIKAPVLKPLNPVQVKSTPALLGSMFERIQNAESCHSCRGVK